MNLTFHWPDYRKVSFELPGMILLSLMLHGVAFTLFQVVYPPSGSLAPPPATITLLTPSTPENSALLSWVNANDPALTSKPQEVVPPGLLDLPYVPSYAELNTEPSPGPILQAPPTEVPSIMDSQSILASLARAGTPKASRSSPAPQRTQVRISDALASRTPKADWTLPARSNPSAISPAARIEPAQFMVGVNAAGEVAYRFLQHSSRDPELDREAEALIANAAFAPGGKMSWGMISFNWGCEVYGIGTAGAK